MAKIAEIRSVAPDKMADQLFEYFLVYATDWESEEMELVDADQLFRQILDDYAYSLESSGMQVQLQFSPVSGQIQVESPGQSLFQSDQICGSPTADPDLI